MAQFNSFPDQKTNTNLSRYVSDITYKNCFKILLKKIFTARNNCRIIFQTHNTFVSPRFSSFLALHLPFFISFGAGQARRLTRQTCCL